jgi:hypothetical protein
MPVTNIHYNVSIVGQWLHRSAFSFGGISGRGPQSSQVRGNLVLGTKETNTKMIRSVTIVGHVQLIF